MRLRVFFHALALALCALAVVVIAQPAYAADAQVAIHLEGPNSEAARAHVAALLPKSVTVVDGRAFTRALAAAGQKGPFGRTLAPNVPRERVVAIAKTAGAAVHADGVVLGRTVKAGKGTELTLVYVDVARGEAVVDRAVPIGGKDDTAALRPVLAPAFEKLGAGGAPKPETPAPATPPTTTPAPAPDAPLPADAPEAAATPDKPDASPADKSAAHDVATELFEIGAALDLGARRFDYKDPLLPEQATLLRSHRVFGTVALALNAAVYPLARSGTKVLKDIGLTLEGAHAFGVVSKLPGGTQVDSSYDRYDLGLRGRIRAGGATAPVIGIGGGYGRRTFGFGVTAPALDGSLPAVSYSQLRGGADVRIPVSIAAIVVGADYLVPLSAGIVESRFHGAKVGGIDGRVGLGVRVATGVEARFLASYTRYFYSFKPAVGDAYVAGGALDEFFSLALGVAYVY